MEPIVNGQVIGPAGELVASEMALPLSLPELPPPMPDMPGMGVEVVPDMPVPDAGTPVVDPGMPVMDEVGVVVMEGMVPPLVGVPVEPFIAGIAPLAEPKVRCWASMASMASIPRTVSSTDCALTIDRIPVRYCRTSLHVTRARTS